MEATSLRSQTSPFHHHLKYETRRKLLGFHRSNSGSDAEFRLPVPSRASRSDDMKFVEQPHPDWKPGQKQPHPFPDDEMIEFEPHEEKIYPFLISSVVPRPIAFLCSVNTKGGVNLAPFSYFNALAHDPPVVAVGICETRPSEERPDRVKDSLQNILETKEFTLNMISEWFVEAANHTSGNYPPEANEVELAGLTSVPSKMVKAPRINESVVQFECKLRDTHDVKNKEGKWTTTIVLAEIVYVHVNKHVTNRTENGSLIVDFAKYAPVGRAGGAIYLRSAEAYEIPRPP